MGQASSQAPQCFVSELMLISHPFERGSSSQSAYPSAQAIVHVPPEQLGVPLAPEQAAPQAPQWLVLVLRLTSQPLSGSLSQSSKGATQPPFSKSMRQIPLWHLPYTALGGSQVAPQSPQWSKSVFRFTSQPSDALRLQSPRPKGQINTQRSSTQSTVAPSSPGGAMQSELNMQARPGSQGAQGPPQSTSTSPPFFTRSEHVGSAQVPERQTELAQSAFPAHFWPASQGAHSEPPQSTSDSPPFRSPSTQLAAWHFPPIQLSFAQSAFARHCRPRAQGAQSMPPQSVSDSSAS